MSLQLIFHIIFFILLGRNNGIQHATVMEECGLSDYEPPPPAPTMRTSRLDITNGHEVPSALDMPWMAAIHLNATLIPIMDHDFLCSSTILSSKFILTAGHCAWYAYEETGLFNFTGPFPPIDYAKLIIYAGSTNFSSPSATMHRSKRVFIHPNFTMPYFFETNQSIHDDIAIIELEKPLELSNTIRPICLNANDSIWSLGDSAFIAGWGKLTNNKEVPPNLYNGNWIVKTLHDERVKLVDVRLCQKIIEPWAWNESICVQCHSTCPYNGDSGGPLLLRDGTKKPAKWTQIGVTSAGQRGGFPPDLFTRTSYHCRWIYSITKIQCKNGMQATKGNVHKKRNKPAIVFEPAKQNSDEIDGLPCIFLPFCLLKKLKQLFG